MLTRLAPLFAGRTGLVVTGVRHWGGFKKGSNKKKVEVVSDDDKEERVLREWLEKCERERAKRRRRKGSVEPDDDEEGVREMTEKEERKYAAAAAKKEKKTKRANAAWDKKVKEREIKMRKAASKQDEEQQKTEAKKKKKKAAMEKDVAAGVCPLDEDDEWEESRSKSYSASGQSYQSVKVAITGADSPAGQMLAFLLKSNKCVGEIRIHGTNPALNGSAMELGQISSRTSVLPYVGPNELKTALHKADIVVIQGGYDKPCPDSDGDLFDSNAAYIQEVATACVTSCPDALVAITVAPVNSTLPLFAEIMKQNGVFCPNRVMGVASEPYVCAKRMVARLLGLDPKTIWLPMTGGATSETVVPIISKTKPGGMFLNREGNLVVKALRECPAKLKNANKGCTPSLSSAYATASFIDVLAKGLCGEETEPYPVLVRSDLIPELEYMVLPVELGVNGISWSHGVPAMSPEEHALMSMAIPQLIDDIQAAKEYADRHISNVAQASPHVPKFNAQSN